MSSNTPPKLHAFHLTTLAAALASALLFTSVQAAGLGELSVHSSLGQPLRADVELLLNAKDEEGALQVKLASPDAYRQANIEFNAALSSLRFVVERRADRTIVRVTSAQPVNEPFLDLLLEVSGGSGRVMREYVLLLDPPTLYAAPAAQPNVLPQSGKIESRSESGRAPSQKKLDKPIDKAADKPIGRPIEKQASGKPRLTLSSATSLAPGRPAVNAEEYAAMEKAVTDANARVQSLEQKVDDLQKLLEATNGLLVEMQKQSELAKANAQAAPVASVESKPAPASQATPAVAPAVKPQKPVAPADPGMDIAELLLPGAGLLAVLVGAFGVFRMRRKRMQHKAGAPLFNDSGKEAASPSAPAGMPHTVGVTTMLNPIPLSTSAQVDPNEVDVVSEADVYIAFGRDVQAEQVLKEALRVQPQRHAARVKLLTIYAARKDLAAFELLATELYSMTKGEGDDWAQAAAMGREIDPGNPLYASARPAAANMAALEAVPEVSSAKTEIGNFTSAPEVDLTPLPQVPDFSDATPVELLPAEDDKSPVRASNGLDFNLSSLNAAEPEVPVIPSEPVFIPQPDAEPVALDFEMPAVSMPATIDDTAVTSATEAQPGSGPIDFDFLLPEIPIVTPKEVEAPAATEVDIGLMDLEFLEPEAEEKSPR